MDKTVRELITLQIGHYANFIGTHWWNLQEASFVYDNPSETDINHDFLFAEGLTQQRQETFTPRLLSVDFKGNLRSLPVAGSLYNPLHSDPSTNEASWDGQIELIHQLPQEKNEFLRDLEQEDVVHVLNTDEDKDICIDDEAKVSNTPTTLQKLYDLQNSVRVWSDFLRPHLHPNTIYTLDDNIIVNGKVSEQGCWGFCSGATLWQREDIEEEITDRIRKLAESCGSLQGFQLLADTHDGMGGLSSGILYHLKDEFGSKDMVTFAAMPPYLSPQIPQSRLLILASIIQSYATLSESSMFIPLGLRNEMLGLQSSPLKFPHITYKADSPYESSSICASFIDTVTLAYRGRHSPVPLSHLVGSLTVPMRKIVGGSVALPMGINNKEYLFDWFQNGKPPSLVTLSGEANLNVNHISELRVIRGIPPSQILRPKTQLPPGKIYGAANHMYQAFLEESGIPPSRRMIISPRDPLKIPSSFPHIFNSNVMENGYLNSQIVRTGESVNSVPCIAGLHQGGGISYLIQSMLSAAERLDVTKVPRLIDDGMDRDAWKDVTEQLRSIHGAYSPERMSESSDDDY